MSPLAALAVAVALCAGSTSAAPHVSSLDPRTGSLAGGVRVTIKGEGFADSLSDAGNTVAFGPYPCNVLPLHSTVNQIVCETTPGTGSNHHVSVVVNGAHTATTCGNNCRFSYQSGQTYYADYMSSGVAQGDTFSMYGAFGTFTEEQNVRLVTPSREVDVFSLRIDNGGLDTRNSPLGPAGSSITIDVDPETDEPALLTSNVLSGVHNAVRPAGRFNVSATWVGSRGTAFSRPQSYNHDDTGTPYQVTIVPAVTSVSPSVGSVAGGTRITVTGTSFNPEDVSVTVGGVPCAVETASTTSVTCVIAADAAHAPIVDASCPAVSPLTADAVPQSSKWLGSRGIVAQEWDYSMATNNQPSSLPARVLFLDGMHNQRYTTSPRTTVLTAWFIPPKTGVYRFMTSSDDNSRLWLNTEPGVVGGAVQIAIESGHTGLFTYVRDSWHGEMSGPYTLEAGKPYFMQTQAQNGAGPGFHHIGVYMSGEDLLPTNADLDATTYRMTEHLEVRLSTDFGAPTTDRLVVTQRAIGVDNTTGSPVFADNATVTLSFDAPAVAAAGLSPSVAVPVTADGATIAQAVDDTLSTSHCVHNNGGEMPDVYRWDTFETGNDYWAWRGRHYGQRLDESFCGRGSMRLSQSVVRVYEATSAGQYPPAPLPGNYDDGVGHGRYDSDDFPYICMALKARPNAKPALLLLVSSSPDANGAWAWRRINFPTYSGNSFTHIGDFDLPIDNTWNHGCVDADFMLDQLLGDVPHYVAAIIFWSGDESWAARDVDSEFFVDEFAVSARPITITRTSRPDVFASLGAGYKSTTVSVASTQSVDANGTHIRTTEWTFNSVTECGLPWDDVAGAATPPPPASAVVSDATATAVVTRASVGAAQRHGRLGIYTDFADPVWVDATPKLDALEAALNSLPGVEGVVVDVGMILCGDMRYYVHFPATGENYHDLQFNADDSAMGDVIVYTRRDSGFLLPIIPGDYLRTVENTPTVVVTSNGISSGCRAQPDIEGVVAGVNPCGFNFSVDATPVVASVAPATGAPGDTITITGSQLGGGVVTVGGTPCPVTGSPTASEVSCVVDAALHGGVHGVVVTVPGVGSSIVSANATNFSFAVSLAVDGVSPAAGSPAGGVVLTVSGSGFPDSPAGVTVGVGPGAATPCAVQTSSYSALTCVVGTAPPNATGEGIVTVSVAPACAAQDGGGGRRLGAAFSPRALVEASAPGFSFVGSSEAPVLTGVSPSVVSAASESVLTLTGERFPTTAAAAVTVGTSACSPATVVSNTTVTCTLPAGVVGDFTVTLGFDSVGNAVGEATTSAVLALDSTTPSALSSAGGTVFTAAGLGVHGTLATFDLVGSRKATTAVTWSGANATSSSVTLTADGESTAPIPVMADAATIAAAVAGLASVDGASVEVSVEATPSSTVWLVSHLPAAAPASTPACISPLFLDWQPWACPSTATSLFHSLQPSSWPFLFVDAPDGLGTSEYIAAATAACEAEALSLAIPFTTSVCSVEYVSTNERFCRDGDDVGPCWDKAFTLVRTPNADGETFSQWQRASHAAPTLTTPGYVYWTPVGAGVAAASSAPEDSIVVAPLASARTLTVPCSRTDDGTNPDTATCRAGTPPTLTRTGALTSNWLQQPTEAWDFAAPTAPQSADSPYAAGGLRALQVLSTDHLIASGHVTGTSGAPTAAGAATGSVVLPVGASFSGTGSGLEATFQPARDTPAGVAVEAMVRVAAGNPAGVLPVLASAQVAADGTSGWLLAFDTAASTFELWVGQPAAVNTTVNTVNTTASAWAVVASAPVPTATWLHVAAVVDADAATASVLVNGVVSGTAALPSAFRRNTGAAFRVGGCMPVDATCAAQLAATVHHVALFTEPLPAASIAAHVSLPPLPLHMQVTVDPSGSRRLADLPPARLLAPAVFACSTCTVSVSAATPIIRRVFTTVDGVEFDNVGYPSGVLTVEGSGFLAGVELAVVGDAPCAVDAGSVSDTSFTCTVDAGAAGEGVEVFIVGAGLAEVGATVGFALQHFVSTVSPAAGSVLGGTVVTIAGFGFADAPTVAFGNGVPCNVTASTTTSITCTTGAHPAASAFTGASASYTAAVAVSGRAATDAVVCTAVSTCELFAWASTGTPVVTSVTSSAVGATGAIPVTPGATLTFAAANLTAGTTATLTHNDGAEVACVLAGAPSPSDAQCTLPAVMAGGAYSFAIHAPGLGAGYVPFTAVFVPVITAATTTPGGVSVAGGASLTLAAAAGGLASPSLAVSVGGTPAVVTDASDTSITVTVPPAVVTPAPSTWVGYALAAESDWEYTAATDTWATPSSAGSPGAVNQCLELVEGPVIVTGSTTWTDVSVSTTLETSDGDTMGFVLRRADADNYVVIGLTREDAGCAWAASVVNGVQADFVTTPGLHHVKNVAYRVSVTAVGSSFTLSMDGTVLATYDLPAAPAAGQVGFMTAHNGDVTFSDTTIGLSSSFTEDGDQLVDVVVGPATQAVCGTNVSCVVDYRLAATPTVTGATVVPATGAALAVNVSGTQFSSTIADNTVTVGGAACTVESANATTLTCTLPNGLVAGTAHAVRVHVAGLGDAVSNATAQSTVAVASVSPPTGSLAGGSVLTIAGAGFSPVPADNHVSLCGRPCEVTQSSPSELTCVTSASHPVTSADVVGLGTGPLPEFDLAVASWQDDAEEESDSDVVVLRNTDRHLSLGPHPLAAFRWCGVPIPGGASIPTANLVLSSTTDTCQGATLSVSAQAAPAEPFATIDGDISRRQRTNASVTWDVTRWSWQEEAQWSPDVAGIVEEVVAGAAWQRGSCIAFIVEHVSGAECEVLTAEYGVEVDEPFKAPARLVGKWTPPPLSGAADETCDAVVTVAPAAAAGGAFAGADLLQCGAVVDVALGAKVDFVTTGEPFVFSEGEPWEVADARSGSFFTGPGDVDSSLVLSLTHSLPAGTLALVHSVRLEFDATLPPAAVVELSDDGGVSWFTWQPNVVPANTDSTLHFVGAGGAGVLADTLRVTVPATGGEPWELEDVHAMGCGLEAAPGATATAAGAFSYALSSTPVVESVIRGDGALQPDGATPRSDGTPLGSSPVTITGTFPGVASSGDVTVDIGGVPCAVSSATSTQVECTSGATTHTDGGPKLVTVRTASQGNSAESPTGSAVWTYIDRWSSTTTWGGGPPPTPCGNWATDKTCTYTIHIPAGQTILLDVSPGRFYLFLIEGTLIFDRVSGIALEASFILVRGGALEVGTEASPFMEEAAIRVYGHHLTPELPTFGAKGLFVYRGRLDLHGRPHTVAWTNLDATADVGATTITTVDAVDWPVGAALIVTSTDWVKEHAETVVIAAVEAAPGGGSVITLEAGLEHKHLGEDRELGGKSVPFRAEVGLLSRNIVFEGADSNTCTSLSVPNGESCTQFGGQIMLHSPGDNSLIGRIQGVELRNTGQAFRLGRYAIHFHMIGSVSQSYVKQCSIHTGFNRGIALHGVHHLEVEDVVTYNVLGHTFFIEDGIETFNVLNHNLAVLTRASTSLLNTDQTPASFWIVNAHNRITNNVAAGSENYGFWYRPELSLTGTSANTPGHCPNGVPLLEFDGNVAHSNGRYGLRIFDVYTPVADVSGCSGEPTTAEFTNMLSYRNQKNGVTATAIGHVAFTNFTVADNMRAGFEYRQISVDVALGVESPTRITNAHIIGLSDAADLLPANETAEVFQGRGINGPISAGLVVDGATFVNYVTGNFAALHACAVCGTGGSPMIGQGGFDVSLNNTKWVNTPNKFHWRVPFEGIWHDLDGTLSGTGVPNTEVVSTTSLLDPDHCAEYEVPANSTAGGLGTSFCSGVTVRRISGNSQQPDSLKSTPLWVRRLSPTPGEWHLVPMLFKGSPTHGFGYTFSVTTNRAYELRWDLDEFERVDLEYFAAVVYGMTVDEHVWLTVDHWTWEATDPLDRALYTARVASTLGGGWVAAATETAVTAWDTEPLATHALPTPVESRVSWFAQPREDQDPVTGVITPNGAWLSWAIGDCPAACNHGFTLQVSPCPFEGCWPAPSPAPAPAAEEGAVSWCNPETWEGTPGSQYNPMNFVDEDGNVVEGQVWAGALPGEGDNVWIQPGTHVVIDCDLAGINFGRIVVEGKLTLSALTDGLDHVVLDADYIELRGGVMQAGTEEQPFDKLATITLHGHRHSTNLVFGQNIFVAGAKTLAVFGELNLFGTPIATSFAVLDTTAAAGDTTLVVRGDLSDWVAGNEVVVTPTGYQPLEAEKLTLAADAVVTGTGEDAMSTLTLASPLAYEHIAITEAHGDKSMEMRARVGLLTRNIVVQGGLDVDPITGTHTGFGRLEGGELAADSGQEFGVTIMAGSYRETGSDGRRFEGAVRMDSVEVRFGGQNGFDDRFSVHLQSLKAFGDTSFVRRCAIHSGFATGVGLTSSSGATVTDNVIYRTVGRGVTITRSSRVVLARNLVATQLYLGSYLTNRWAAEEFLVDGCVVVEATASVAVVDNYVAGCERAGFRLAGRPCSSPAYDRGADPVDTSKAFLGNTAVAAMFGLFIMDMPEECGAWEDFTAWRCWNFGVYADHVSTSVQLTGFALADNTAGSLIHLKEPAPLLHEREDKTVVFTNGLMVGRSQNFRCDLRASKPMPMCWSVKSNCLPPSRPHAGMWWPIFNSVNNHAPNISPWWGIGHYPAIGGRTFVTDVTAASFGEVCGVRDVAMEPNPALMDFQHEVVVSGWTSVGVDDDSLMSIPPPNPAYLVIDDCSGMDCDGFRSVLVTDVDGTLLGAPGSVTSRADVFSEESTVVALPATMLTTTAGELLTEADVVPNGYGFPGATCVRKDAWNAMKCDATGDGPLYTTLVLESMDIDTEIRRLSPVAVSSGGWTHLVNGPADHGWCFGYTCLKRISTFYTPVAVGQPTMVHFTGTNPSHLRLHLINAAPDETIVLSIFYTTPQRINVYTEDGTLVEDLNVYDGVRKQQLVREGRWPSNQVDGAGWTDVYPGVEHPHGANAFNRFTKTLTVTLRGDRPLDVVVMPVVQVSMSLAVSVEDFYEQQDNFVENLAYVLGINPANIYVVSVVAGSAVVDFEVTPSPEFSFAEASYTVLEDALYANVTVARALNMMGNATLQYVLTTDGTAEPGVHFTPGNATLEFQSQQTTATVLVPVMYDPVYEAVPRTIVLQLLNATGATVGAQASATIQVVNVDTPAALTPTLAAASSSSLLVEWDVPTEWVGAPSGYAIAHAQVQLMGVDPPTSWGDALVTSDVEVLTADGTAAFTATGLPTYSSHVARMRHSADGVLWSEWSANSEAAFTLPVCGDGVREGAETCDIGFRVGQNNTGCSATCVIQAGFSCSYSADIGADVCEAGCGDNIKAGAEECDGTLGCDASCRIADGWACDAAGAVCATVCGDGVLAGDEVCDAGTGLVGSDGCATDCMSVVAGWTCDTKVQPSSCASCGNGVLEPPEVCDDNNTMPGDGCDACGVELGWVCDGGEPTVCLGGPAAVVLPPTVSNVRETQADVAWTPPSGNGLSLTVTRVWAQTPPEGESSFTGQPWVLVANASAAASKATITNLTDGVQYRFAVAAETAAGQAPLSPASVAVLTLEIVESELNDVSESLVNATATSGSIGGLDVGGLEVEVPPPSPTPPPVVEEVDVDDPDFDPDAFNNTGLALPSPTPSPSPIPVVVVGQGEFSVAEATVSAVEGGADVVVTVLREGGAFGTVTVAWSVGVAGLPSNATAAVEGQDFDAASGELTFEFSVTSATFTVPVLDSGSEWRPDRSFVVALSAPSGTATLGHTPSLVVTVTDSDPLPLIAADAGTIVNEYAGFITMVVRRSVNVAGNASVGYTVVTTGAGFTLPIALPANGTLHFSAGESIKTFQVAVADDGFSDATYTREVTLTLDAASAVACEVFEGGAATTHTVQYVACGVVDGHPCPQLDFALASNNVSEVDTTSVTVHVLRSVELDRTVSAVVSASYPRDASDAGFLSISSNATLTFGSGQTTASVVMAVSRDVLNEDAVREMVLAVTPLSGGAVTGPAASYTLHAVYVRCALLSDCSAPSAPFKAVRTDVTLAGVAVSSFDEEEYKEAVAAGLTAADSNIVVHPDAVVVESVTAGPNVDIPSRRLAIVPSVVVTTTVTSSSTGTAAAADAAAMTAALQDAHFAEGVATVLPDVVVTVAAPVVVDTTDAAIAASPSPLPPLSESSSSGTPVWVIAVGVVVAVGAVLGGLFVVFNRRQGNKITAFAKPTIAAHPGGRGGNVAPAGHAPTAKSSAGDRVTYFPWRCTSCGFKNLASAPKCEVCRKGLPPMRAGRKIVPTPALSPQGTTQLFTRVKSPSPNKPKNARDMTVVHAED